MTKNNNARRTVVSALLLIGIAVLLWLLLSDKDPEVVARERLMARAQDYSELREQNDWAKLYDLTDPRQRERMDLRSFLQGYGSGALKVHKAEVQNVDFDPRQTFATTQIKIDAELDPSKLPPELRPQIPDPSAARKEAEFSLEWVWRDGEWYYRIDSEIEQGVDKEGKTVTPMGQRPAAGGPPRTPPTPGKVPGGK